VPFYFCLEVPVICFFLIGFREEIMELVASFGSSRKSVGKFQWATGLKDAWTLGFGAFEGHGNLA
jgi:hypothetical protein